jgi:hypothetical protein
VFASGWLDRETVITGKGGVEILWIQFQNAALLPFKTLPHGHYRPEPPFAGWPLVIPLAIGLAVASLAFWRRQYFGLVMAFWATVVGLALTAGPPETNRYTSSGPFLAIFAALGIATVARIAIRLLRAGRTEIAGAAAIVAALIVAWHLNFTFRDGNQIAIYSDTNTQVANGVAREAETFGRSVTVYFAGAPRLTMSGFANVEYIADEATRIDVIEPWQAADARPRLTGKALFAFVPERSDELEIIRGWFPGGAEEEHFLPNGELLYISYLVDPAVIALQAPSGP